jgi:methylase of polypeptide subunit release factors
LGDDIDVSEIEPVLAPLGIDGLAALGLCVMNGSTVSPMVLLVPHGEHYVACDLNPRTGSEASFDFVPGVQAPSVTLAKLAVRTAAGSALDLGTGSGLQAMLAARHCRTVVATDVNERALEFARFNARLNGLENIEFCEGSAFSPVAGQRFDLVVANPPYVISPDYTYAYRDSEIPGDELCRQLVQQVPAHLNDGGFAQILVSWGDHGAEDCDLPWVADGGCDAWLLHYRTRSPLQHATDWLRPVGEDDATAFAAALDRWLAYLAERGIASVSYGAIVLRRGTRPGNWIQAQQLPPERLEPASDHILRAFNERMPRPSWNFGDGGPRVIVTQ